MSVTLPWPFRTNTTINSLTGKQALNNKQRQQHSPSDQTNQTQTHETLHFDREGFSDQCAVIQKPHALLKRESITHKVVHYSSISNTDLQHAHYFHPSPSYPALLPPTTPHPQLTHNAYNQTLVDMYSQLSTHKVFILKQYDSETVSR